MRRLPEILLWLALASAWPLAVSAQEVTAEQLAQRLAAYIDALGFSVAESHRDMGR